MMESQGGWYWNELLMSNDVARVLDVGNCDPDHGAIRLMVTEAFDAQVDRVMFVPDAMKKLADLAYDLVLVNRLVFDDGSPGIDLVRQMKADERIRNVPVMLISNYADAQSEAKAAGAIPGFGKAAVGDSVTVDLLAEYLPRK